MTENDNSTDTARQPFFEREDIGPEATVVVERSNLRVISYRPPAPQSQTSGPAPGDTPPAVNLLARQSVRQRLQLEDGPSRRYEKLGRLGEGSTAVVYAVRDNNCDREIAVKIPKQEAFAEEPRQLQRFLAEAGIAARLQHPNIIPIYDLDVDDTGQVYLAMRKVEGTTLRDDLAAAQKRGGYPPGDPLTDLVRIFLKICDALSFAHSRGLVHQDVKPENIALGQYGEVFVIDWGASATCSDEMALTPAYMSPQQARAQSPTPSDDIYCLGATLFHCLLLRLPTDAPTLEELVRKKREGAVDLPTAAERKRAPAALLDVALKAMAPQPEDRYQTIAALAEDLRQYQAGLAVSAHHDTLLEFLARWYRQHRRNVWTLAAIVLVLIGAGLLVRHEIGKRRRAQQRRQQEEQRRLAADRKRREIEARLEARWATVYIADFRKGRPEDFPFLAFQVNFKQKTMDPKPFEAIAECRRGALELRPLDGRFFLQYNRDIPEAARVEMRLLNRGRPGPNLGISISGDPSTGHRLRIYGYNHIELESEQRGRWEVLHHCRTSLDPEADGWNIAYWREGNTFRATIDGREILDYYDPMAVRGPKHRTIAVSRFSMGGTTPIQSLRIAKAEDPELVDILEPGRVMLRRADFAGAQEWFAGFINDDRSDRIRQEAQYLYAMAINEKEEPQRKLKELQTLATIPDFRFHKEVLVLLAFQQAERAQFREAIRTLGQALEAGADRGLSLRLIMAFRLQQQKLGIADFDAMLKDLGRMPQVEELNLKDWRISTLAPLAGLKLRRFICTGPIQDLQPLAGMPLEFFRINHAGITNLTPLRGMPLRVLSFAACLVMDVTPLRGAPLTDLDCTENRIRDLSPLDGMTLRTLNCSKNPDLQQLPKLGPNLGQLNCSHCAIESLVPIRSARLRVLKCSGNRIVSLAPVAGMPLEHVECAHNRITDLSPLQGNGLRWLDCGSNRIADLAPLAGMPLEHLRCSTNQISDLTPIADAPLAQLYIAHNQIHDLTGLPAERLRSLDAANNRIRNLAPLRNAKRLQHLNLSHNQIRDLGPLRDLPLEQLQIADNPITDFSALRGKTLEHLDLHGCALNAAALNDLATVKSEGLRLGLERPGHLRLLTRLAGLRYVNAVRADVVKKIAVELNTCLNDKPADLRQYAVVAGNSRLLLVPQECDDEMTAAICRNAGARVFEPRTPQQVQALTAYLKTVARPHVRITVNCAFDPETETVRWRSDGAPFDTTVDKTDLPTAGQPIGVFVVTAQGEPAIHRSAAGLNHHFVLEWTD